MNTSLKKIFATIFFSLFALSSNVFAQCAMCRATIENNISSGEGTIGMGLNTGILYLMVMPYLLIAVIAYYWYKNSKKRQLQKDNVQTILKNKLGLE